MKKYFLITTTYFLYVLLSIFMKPGIVSAVSYPAGTLVKVANQSSIYYIASDSSKYKIPDEVTFRSWYSNFSEVKTISSVDFNSYKTAKYNVTAEPIKQLVKFSNAKKVYVVDTGAVLRGMADEQTAMTYYGSDWNKKIITLPSVDFNDYKFGTDLNMKSSFSKTYAAGLSSTIDAELRNRGIISGIKSSVMVASVELEPLLRSMTENLHSNLQPGFNTRTNNYFITADYDESSFTLKPLATDTDLFVYVNGTPVATYASINLSLGMGKNDFVIKVVNQNGTENVYTLEVLREVPNENNYIRKMTENLRANFDPGFNANTTEYNIRSEYDETTFSLNILAEDTLETVYVNDQKLSGGYTGTASILLNVGENKITIRVVAENGANRYYYITVTHYQYPKLGENDLASLTTNFVGGFSPAFDPKQSIYYVTADVDVTRFLVSARAQSSKTRVIINGTQTNSKYVSLNYGDNDVKIMVEIPGQPDFTKTYTIKVYRKTE